MEKIVGEGVKFERIRRVTGYLSGDVSRFNNGKRAEECDDLYFFRAAKQPICAVDSDGIDRR